jgi:hypothetical protein
MIFGVEVLVRDRHTRGLNPREKRKSLHTLLPLRIAPRVTLQIVLPFQL